MLAMLAALVLAPLLYIPGALLALAWLGPARPRAPLERHYERVLAGALLNGYLALTLAELGIFSAWLHLLLVGLFCLACALVAARRGALGWSSSRLGIAAGGVMPRVASRAWLARHASALLLVAVLLGFAALVARPFEVVLGGRDAGVYATTGLAIARTGGIVQHDALLQQIALDQQSEDPTLRAAAAQAETNFLGIQPASRNIATRLRFAGYLINQGDLARGLVTPQFFHLYPAWVALLASLLGLRGGLLATSLLGLLGVWSVGMLGRRLAGGWVGLLGALFLALNGAQVWFSRYSTSEAAAQFLSFAALYGFAAMHARPAEAFATAELQRQGARAPRPRTTTLRAFVSSWFQKKPNSFAPEPQAVSSDVDSSRRSFAGLLAGLAAGQLALTRVDFFPLVVPLLAYLAYLALARRWNRPAWALALSLGAMLAQAGLHILFISRAYFLDLIYARLQDQSAIAAALAWPLLTPALREQFMNIPRSAPLRAPYRLPLEIGLLVVLVVAFVLLRRDGRPQRWLERQVLRRQTWLLRLGAALVLALGVYGYLVRPQILGARTLAALPGCLAGAASPECLALQGYIGAPIAAPEHPNAVAYALDVVPQWLRGMMRPAATMPVVTSQPGELRELPRAGSAVLGHVEASEVLSLRGRDSTGTAYLATNDRGVTGWIDTAAIAEAPAELPVQPDNALLKIVNPRLVTTFSPGNAGDSQKAGIAQANLVRVGWYMSPLGMLLGLFGAALWWRRGFNRASWLFLIASLAGTFFFVRLSYGTTDLTYIYILRRYIPLAYPALSLCAAYAIVALARRPATVGRQPKPATGQGVWHMVVGGRWSVVVSAGLVLALVVFFVATNRALYRHVEYQGALDQLGAIAQEFGPGDVLLFRGEGRDTPDLMITPLQYGFGLNAFAIRSPDPGKYAAQLADYVRRWQAQGRQVYMGLGANGAVGLPGLRAVRVGPAALRLPEFQQLRDQKPSLPVEFTFDFTLYRLEPADAPAALGPVAVDDFAAQVRGFYHPEQIGGATVAWTDGDAVLRLPWPRNGAPLAVSLSLAPGATRPAALGPARACVSYQPAADYALPAAPFLAEHCFELEPGMREYQYTVDLAGRPAPPTGALLLRIAGPTWVPAEADPAQHDPRKLGVQFGGLRGR